MGDCCPGLQCWQCGLAGNTCLNTSHPGTLTSCPPEVTSCFKSQTSSASPVVVRRCGDRDTGSRCLESTIIQQSQQEAHLSAWVCHCTLEGCNSSVRQADNCLLLLL